MTTSNKPRPLHQRQADNNSHYTRVRRDESGVWRRYQNRKKTIRERYLNGYITADQKDYLYEEAREAYLASELSEGAKAYAEKMKVAENYIENIGGIGNLAEPAPAETGECNEECWSAKQKICRCDCIGQNHGAAHGTEPWEVTANGYSIQDRVEMGLLPPEALEWRKEAMTSEKSSETIMGVIKTDLAIEHDWKLQAACRGLSTDLFFSEIPAVQDKAKAICAECEVKEECANYAHAVYVRYKRDRDLLPDSELWQVYPTELYGVWGGKTQSRSLPPGLSSKGQTLIRRMRKRANIEGVWEGTPQELIDLASTIPMTFQSVYRLLRRLEESGDVKKLHRDTFCGFQHANCRVRYQVCDTQDAPIPTQPQRTSQERTYQWLLEHANDGVWEGKASTIAAIFKISPNAVHKHFYHLKKKGQMEDLGAAEFYNGTRKYSGARKYRILQ